MGTESESRITQTNKDAFQKDVTVTVTTGKFAKNEVVIRYKGIVPGSENHDVTTDAIVKEAIGVLQTLEYENSTLTAEKKKEPE
jgi:hypothetical protein